RRGEPLHGIPGHAQGVRGLRARRDRERAGSRARGRAHRRGRGAGRGLPGRRLPGRRRLRRPDRRAPASADRPAQGAHGGGGVTAPPAQRDALSAPLPVAAKGVRRLSGWARWAAAFALVAAAAAVAPEVLGPYHLRIAILSVIYFSLALGY